MIIVTIVAKTQHREIEIDEGDIDIIIERRLKGNEYFDGQVIAVQQPKENN